MPRTTRLACLTACHVAVESVLPTQCRQGDLRGAPGAVQTTTQRDEAALILLLVKEEDDRTESEHDQAAG